MKNKFTGLVFFITAFVLITSCQSKMEKLYSHAKKLSKSEKPEDWEKAIKEYDKIIAMKINAREYQALLYRKLGKYSMQFEHWNDALKYYKKALEILPNDGVLHCKLGVCYSQLSRSQIDKKKKMELVQKAVDEYKLATQLTPDYADSYFGLGIIYFYVYKDYSQGIKYMAKVLKIDPRSIDAHFALGRFYYEIGELNKALEFYKALLSLVPEDDPRYKKVKENISKIYNQMQNY